MAHNQHPGTHNGDLRHLPAALTDLVIETRWVIWRWQYVPARKKWTKVPFQPADPRRKARSNDPSTWSSHDASVDVVESRKADGIGFMLKDSNVAAFDIDDCRNPETGEIASWAWKLVIEAASYTEVTVSGTGLRIIGLGAGPHVHRNQVMPGTDGGRIETYRRASR